MSKTGTISLDIDEYISDASDDALLDEMEERGLVPRGQKVVLTEIYEEFRRRGDAPQVLQDFLYDTIGRTL